EDEPHRSSNRKWVLISVVTLAWHLLMLETPIFRGGWKQEVQPPIPIDMQEIDAAKLRQIREQWKARDQALLLSKDQTPPDPNAPKPKDARYISDRNRTVEREQRAAETNVVPATRGTRAERDQEGRAGRTAPQAAPGETTEKLPDLSNLGVPIATSRPPRPKPVEAQEAQRRGGADQGDQAIRDTELPVGAENLLNTQESVYYSFYARIYEAIG